MRVGRWTPSQARFCLAPSVWRDDARTWFGYVQSPIWNPFHETIKIDSDVTRDSVAYRFPRGQVLLTSSALLQGWRTYYLTHRIPAFMALSYAMLEGCALLGLRQLQVPRRSWTPDCMALRTGKRCVKLAEMRTATAKNPSRR